MAVKQIIKNTKRLGIKVEKEETNVAEYEEVNENKLPKKKIRYEKRSVNKGTDSPDGGVAQPDWNGQSEVSEEGQGID